MANNTYRHIVATGDLSKLQDAVNCKCENLFTIVSRNKFTGKQELIEVPCGSCWHCRTQAQNEWVSRMQLHAMASPKKDANGNPLPYKHIYFVTLTYRDITHEELANNAPIYQFMKHTYPLLKNKDDKTFVAEYAPMLVDPSHISIFMRKLRNVLEKRTGLRHTDLSYFACCEYGHENARPHMHFILFDNEPIYKFYVNQAWSLYVGNTRDNAPIFSQIGHVDFKDLYETGAMCHVGYNGSTGENKASNAFSYVAKYCTKREFNQAGVNRVWSLIRDSFYVTHDLEQNPDKMVKCLTGNYTLELNNLIIPKLQYEYENARHTHKTTFTNEELSFLYHQYFLRMFSPSCRSSKSLSIGKFYALSNVERFANGNLSLPKDFNDKDIVSFPHYFIRKTNEYVNGIRQISQTASRSYVRTLPLVLDEIGVQIDDFKNHESITPATFSTSAFGVFDEQSYYLNGNADEQVRRAKRTGNLLTNRWNKEYYMLSPDLEKILTIRFVDKHYLLSASTPFTDFIDSLHLKYEREYDMYLQSQNRLIEEKQAEKTISLMFDNWNLKKIECYDNAKIQREQDNARYDQMRKFRKLWL